MGKRTWAEWLLSVIMPVLFVVLPVLHVQSVLFTGDRRDHRYHLVETRELGSEEPVSGVLVTAVVRRTPEWSVKALPMVRFWVPKKIYTFSRGSGWACVRYSKHYDQVHWSAEKPGHVFDSVGTSGGFFPHDVLYMRCLAPEGPSPAIR